MQKFSCTRSLGEDIYYTTLVAENAQQAREMAVEETNKKWSRNCGTSRRSRNPPQRVAMRPSQPTAQITAADCTVTSRKLPNSYGRPVAPDGL